MARPKLPIAQRKGMVMTVRMRLDLNDGLAAVALLRGTTKSGLVSQYAAEQIRVEQERDPRCFAAVVEDIRSQREARQRTKHALLQLQPPSEAPGSLKAAAEQRRSARPWCLESRPHDRLIEPLYDARKSIIQATRARLCRLARGKRAACGHSTGTSSDINLAPESRE